MTHTRYPANQLFLTYPTIIPAMQRFQVPQFITIEDKIIGGFLTAKQFIYVAAGVISIVAIFFMFQGFLALLLSLLIAAAASALAWGKISEIPIPSLVLHAIFFFVRPRVFIWKRSEKRTDTEVVMPREKEALPIQGSPKLSHSRLSELSWNLDTKPHEDITRR